MNKYFLFLSVLCAVFSIAMADEPVVVRYFVQLGGNVIVPGGDFDGTLVAHIVPDGDTSVVQEDVALPKLPVFPLASVRLGVNIDASSLTMAFGYARPMLTEFPMAIPVAPQHAKWIDFGVEYQYHFLYPATVRPALGASYGFTRINASNATLAYTDKGIVSNNVLYYGQGPGIVAGVGWFGIEHFSANCEMRTRYVSVAQLTTASNNFGVPAKTARLWMLDLGISAQYVF